MNVWRGSTTIPLHSIQPNQKNKRKLFFYLICFHFICGMKRKRIKEYYNSMLKVISWYKLNHKWKTTWIWWKLAGMKWYEFMNGMTFNAAPTSFHQLHFSSLWEWEEKLWVDWNERAGCPLRHMIDEFMNQSIKQWWVSEPGMKWKTWRKLKIFGKFGMKWRSEWGREENQWN